MNQEMKKLQANLVPLVLHKIVKDKALDWEDVRQDEFRSLIDFIGQRCVGLPLSKDKPDARWLLTFDDGYISDYDFVFPLLAERNINAFFFPIIEKIGMPGYLSWGHIEEMHRHGMLIGSHSCSHRHMTSLSVNDATQEFLTSKNTLEDFLGAPVSAFSYPFGDCAPYLHRLGMNAGYKYIFGSMHGVFDFTQELIPRNSINSSMNWRTILKIIDPSVLTRIGWVLEDKFKNTTKKIIGRGNYINLRGQISRIIK